MEKNGMTGEKTNENADVPPAEEEDNQNESEQQAYARCREGVLHGDPNSISPLLKGAVPINSPDVDGNTALALAAFCDHRALVKTLLAGGAHVNAKDSKRETPLHKVCRKGHVEVAELLLEHRAGVNRQNYLQETPLMLACARGHEDVTRVLIKHGADVHACDRYNRLPLHWAIKGGNLEIVKLLHEKKSSFNCMDRFRKNAILQAAKCNQPEILKYVLETDPSGKDQEDSFKRGPLQIAALKNNPDCLSVLIKYGLCINQRINYGKTALMEAAFAGNLESVERLLSSADCNVNVVDNDGSTALIHSIMGRLSSDRQHNNKLWFDVVLHLVKANTDMSIQSRSHHFWDRSPINKHNQNALELALKLGHSNTVELLLHAGSDMGNLSVYFNLPNKDLPQNIHKNQCLFDRIKRFFELPRLPLLKEICRNAIRGLFGSGWIGAKDSLEGELPIDLIEYLNLEDMKDLVSTNHVNLETVRIRELSGPQEDCSGERSENEYEPSA